MTVKNVTPKHWPIAPSADGVRYSAYPNGDKPLGGPGYYVDFTEQVAENPISLDGVWVNNEEGGPGGNAAMLTQASLQIGLADDGLTMILKHGNDDAVDYKDPFGFVPGIAGNQQVTMTLYRSPGYNPGTGHEWHIWLGCIVYGSNNKRCVSVTLNANGSSEIALHDGTVSGYNILGNIVTSLQADTGDKMIAALNRESKTIRLWLKKGSAEPVLLNQISWAVVAGSITTERKALLENLGDGCGAGSYKPPGGDIDAYGATDFLMETFP